MNAVLRLLLAKLFEGSAYKRKVIFGVFLAIISSTSSASWDVILGKVAFVEPSHLPETVVFAMTTGSSSCPAGAVLKWSKTDNDNKYQNNLAVYETLKTALIFDKNVQLYLYSGDTTCEGQFLHLLSK